MIVINGIFILLSLIKKKLIKIGNFIKLNGSALINPEPIFSKEGIPTKPFKKIVKVVINGNDALRNSSLCNSTAELNPTKIRGQLIIRMLIENSDNTLKEFKSFDLSKKNKKMNRTGINACHHYI